MNIKILITLVVFLLINLFQINAYSDENKKGISKNLLLEKLNDNIYIFTSYINYKGNLVPCNTILYKKNDDGFLFRSPHNEEITHELINWVKSNLKVSIKKAFIDHFHEDGGSGGLNVLKNEKIMTYSNKRTFDILSSKKLTTTDKTFDKSLNIDFHNKKITLRYFGGAHTTDGSIAWLNDEKILLAGCMLKELNSKNLGNTSDADMKNYEKTLRNLSNEYKNIKLIIVGHGKSGNKEIIQHNINLLKKYKKK